MNARSMLSALLVALTMAGCGTSSSTAGKGLSPATSQITRQATSQVTGPAAPAASVAPSTPSPSTPAPSTPVAKGGSGSDLQFCQAIALNLQVMEKAADKADDPSVEQTIAQIRHLESIAPAEIKGDLKVIADFDQNIVDALRGGKAPDFKETPALTDALRHQAAWSATHCGH